MPVFYRVWRIPGRQALCRNCKKPIRWVYLDNGKKLPLEPRAMPIRLEQSTSGARFEVYDGEASHLWHCPKKPA